jgi:broad specificity phosphatase PhoE
MDPQSQQTLILIPVGQTDWHAQGRLAGAADLPLNDVGVQQAQALAEQLADEGIKVLCTSDNQTARQTAAILADKLHVPLKTLKGLEDVDIGLWEGLTPHQLKQRYPRAYKQWTERPATICPPQGESLQQAAERLLAAITRFSLKSKMHPLGVVLGPLALTVVRCQLQALGLDNLWQNVDTTVTWHSLTLPPPPTTVNDRK